VDAPLVPPHELIRPWRRATLVASAVAAVELVLLVGLAGVVLAKPLARKVQQRAELKAFPTVKRAKLAMPKTVAVGLPRLARQETGVYILNGNGRQGAAAATASKLKGIGYVVSGTGNAQRTDYATTVVMFRPGYKPEATRLARDLHLKAVGPLDGMSVGALRGGQIAMILGRG
jgi:LytR cell envelope-related transcriptional attenuator